MGSSTERRQGDDDRARARSERLTHDRRLVRAASTVSRRSNTIHLLLEADISRPREVIAAHRRETGERLSLTAHVVTALARTVVEFPEFNAFRRGRRLVHLGEVAVNVLYERDVEGRSVPEPVAVHHAEAKTYRDIHDELRATQAEHPQRMGGSNGTAWIGWIPGWLLGAFVRLASRSTKMKERFGVVAVTAVGMFGSSPLWLVPLSSATIAVAVGTIASRPVLADGSVEEREHLCLTLAVDHDLIDGAPAARFAARLCEHLASATEIEAAIGAGPRQERI